jgi:hypothetical protein
MRRREFITFLGGAAGSSPTSIDVRYFAAFGAEADMPGRGRTSARRQTALHDG